MELWHKYPKKKLSKVVVVVVHTIHHSHTTKKKSIAHACIHGIFGTKTTHHAWMHAPLTFVATTTTMYLCHLDRIIFTYSNSHHLHLNLMTTHIIYTGWKGFACGTQTHETLTTTNFSLKSNKKKRILFHIQKKQGKLLGVELFFFSLALILHSFSLFNN